MVCPSPLIYSHCHWVSQNRRSVAFDLSASVCDITITTGLVANEGGGEVREEVAWVGRAGMDGLMHGVGGGRELG
jgi:hypothetical protein